MVVALSEQMAPIYKTVTDAGVLARHLDVVRHSNRSCRGVHCPDPGGPNDGGLEQ